MDQIQGVNGEQLPWEGERLTVRVMSQLRLFQDALKLLQRDPEQRPSMVQFCRTCSHMLGGVSVSEMGDPNRGSNMEHEAGLPTACLPLDSASADCVHTTDEEA